MYKVVTCLETLKLGRVSTVLRRGQDNIGSNPDLQTSSRIFIRGKVEPIPTVPHLPVVKRSYRLLNRLLPAVQWAGLFEHGTGGNDV